MMNELLLMIVITLLVLVLSSWVVKEGFSQPLIAVEGQSGAYRQVFKVRDRSDR
jgi:hypothetical protein